MSNKIKWNWIAQGSDGFVCMYDHHPFMTDDMIFHARGGEYFVLQGEISEFSPKKWTCINLETHDYKIIDGILIKVDKQDKQQKHSHYKKDVRHLDYIDVYRIIELYELHDPCFQHALKKILVPGARGHKDLTKDINDIIDTMQRKLEMIAENEKKL